MLEVIMYLATAYLCYKLVIFRRRKTREFKEKRRERKNRKK